MRNFARLVLLIAVYGVPFHVAAQHIPAAPFSIIGYIQALKLCDPTIFTSCDPNRENAGATIKVNGITVVLPENLQIIMPGTYMTAHDLVKNRPGRPSGPVVAGEISGLGLEDPHPPGTQFTPITIELSGNIVEPADGSTSSMYIAGLASIEQVPLQTSAGFIRYIDYNKGELFVGPEISASATPAQKQTGSIRVRLNDPTADRSGSGGRFGRAQSPDVRFVVDQDNPTVHAMTGYPVCVPRVVPPQIDPLCPLANRPMSNGAVPLRRFTIGNIPATGDAPACATSNPPLPGQCDSRQMAPLAEGDFVIYAGLWSQTDETGAVPAYVSAYSLEANLGIYTSPGANPAYVAVEESLWGTGGLAFPGVDQETGPGKTIPGSNVVTRFKIVGFTTDPSRNVEIVALDINPVTGEEIMPPRIIKSFPTEPIAPIGRFEDTVGQSIFLPPTREIRARVQGVDAARRLALGLETSANGLSWGEYNAPVGEYLFPEGRMWGQPEVPMNFENLCFLTGRSTGAQPGDAVLPLKPFPYSAHPSSMPELSPANPFPRQQPKSDGTPMCP